tara:strand:- start:10 stop:1926 length:1917 start_codon:yes stop_codon:yes gene_type:complete
MSTELWIEGVIVEFIDSIPCKRAIIRQVKKEQVTLADISSGSIYYLELSLLREKQINGLAKFLSESKDHGNLKFIDLPEEDQFETNRRYKYIKKIKELGITRIRSNNVDAIVSDIAAELAEKPPNWQTIRRWHSSYVKSGEKLKGLYPNNQNKGRREPRLDPRVLEIIRNESKRFFKGSRPTVASIVRNVESKIILHNLDNPCDCLEVPTYPTIRDRLQEVSYEYKQKARSGKRAFAAELATSESGIETTRILERVEIDHTLLDLHVLHDNYQTLLGRPNITVLIDHYSHMVLGFQLSFEKPSFASVSMACKNAFLPKNQLLLNLGCDASWPAHGIPSTIVTDNGNEFWGKNFATTAIELGSIFQYCPIRKGNYKSRVERFFGIVNSLVLDDLPGVVRKPGKCAEGYDARQEARMTFSEFKRYFITWLTKIYHNLPIESSGKTPNELWNESEMEFPIPEEDPSELIPILMASDTRTLNKCGIAKFALSYDSPILKDLFRRDGPREVQIKYDPFDIGYILVLDDYNNTYIKIDCDRYSYASGVSLFEHNKIRDRAKQNAKTKFDNLELQRAKVQLAKERDELHKRNKRRKTQTTVANAARSDRVGAEDLKLVVDNSKKFVQINQSGENEALDLDGWGIE